MSESFLLTNMSPQAPSFNRGIWKRLEEQVRFWAIEKDSILVVSGPVLRDIDSFMPPKFATDENFRFQLLLFNRLDF